MRNYLPTSLKSLKSESDTSNKIKKILIKFSFMIVVLLYSLRNNVNIVNPLN